MSPSELTLQKDTRSHCVSTLGSRRCRSNAHAAEVIARSPAQGPELCHTRALVSKDAYRGEAIGEASGVDDPRDDEVEPADAEQGESK